MSETSDRIREFLQLQTLPVALAVVHRQIRQLARQELRLYADGHFIIDFQDTALVTQRHRNKRTSIIAVAQQRASDATASTDMTALLVVFDDIAPLIE